MTTSSLHTSGTADECYIGALVLSCLKTLIAVPLLISTPLSSAAEHPWVQKGHKGGGMMFAASRTSSTECTTARHTTQPGLAVARFISQACPGMTAGESRLSWGDNDDRCVALGGAVPSD